MTSQTSVAASLTHGIEIQSNEFHNDTQTLIPQQQEDSVMEDANDFLFDSMLVDSSSKLIQNGFTRS